MAPKLQSNIKDILKFIEQIHASRLESCGKSVADYPFASCRVRLVSGINEFKPISKNEVDGISVEGLRKGCVVYWMNRDQRIQDNWALLFAQRVALRFFVPLHVCFNLASSPALRTRRHATFLLEGLAEVEKECKDLDIGFHLLPLPVTKSKPVKRNADGYVLRSESDAEKLRPIMDAVERLGARVVITDFSPLRGDLRLLQSLSGHLPQDIPLYQVDAHNVVPVWFASDKLEYAARTIRGKLHEKANYLFTNFPPVIRHPVAAVSEAVDWKAIDKFLIGLVNESVDAVTWAKGGSRAGFSQLFSFINNRLQAYGKSRNDPTKDALSNLSPWFHFGHISPQRCLWEVKLLRSIHKESVDVFIEEAFVRRELSDNFCYYSPNYDSIKGAWSWAQETLKKHISDARKPAYSVEIMEAAATGDDLWNAAQRQLCKDGKMHGFLRMYWAKKILEWHADGPEEALRFGFHLNDLYSLDGTDPNGYVGVMWSICGVHDQGWPERSIFGKIRFMNLAGCKRKFDVSAFIRKYHNGSIS